MTRRKLFAILAGLPWVGHFIRPQAEVAVIWYVMRIDNEAQIIHLESQPHWRARFEPDTTRKVLYLEGNAPGKRYVPDVADVPYRVRLNGSSTPGSPVELDGFSITYK